MMEALRSPFFESCYMVIALHLYVGGLSGISQLQGIIHHFWQKQLPELVLPYYVCSLKRTSQIRGSVHYLWHGSLPAAGHSNSSSDTYSLKRDYNASTRLTAQHLLWKTDLGYLLHPSITVPEQPRIADVACGNGCWLLDLASSLQQPGDFNGFDISLDQAPTPNSLASSKSSIRFNTWDLTTGPPPCCIGAFDVVHIRLITVVFRENDPVPIIDSLRKLLKPGGYLQWEEVDNTSCNVSAVNGYKAPALELCLSQLAGSGKGEWKSDAGRILNENGFTGAKQLHVKPSVTHSRYWTDLYVSTWAEYVSKVMVNPEMANTLGEEAMKEVRRGATINCPMWVWVAQKK